MVWAGGPDHPGSAVRWRPSHRPGSQNRSGPGRLTEDDRTSHPTDASTPPSGWNDRHATASGSSTRPSPSRAPVAGSQTRSVWSPLPETSREPSGLNATA